MSHEPQMNRYVGARKSVWNQISRMAGIAIMALMWGAIGHADTLATNSYNFQLYADTLGDYGGGGASATLNGTLNVETFCIDFNNNIYVPYAGYNAYLTPLTSTGFVASQTRFANVTSWQNSAIAAELGSDTTDLNTIENAGALARYQMAAYLVSLYNLASPNQGAVFAYNNGIQEAIWQIMDPASYPVTPANTGDPTNALETAAQWLSNPSIDHDSFLANYRIVSDMSMQPGNPLTGGFQEQITYVPEPGLFVAMIFGCLGLLWLGRRNLLAAALLAGK